MTGIFKLFAFGGRSRRFDLPFHMQLGTEFLIFLTGLMTLLCLLAATVALSLNDMADRWTAGLENTLTVEIAASDKQEATTHKILDALKDTQGVKSARLMERAEMDKLLAPWLGDATGDMKDLPVPSLITIELKERDDKILRGITSLVRTAGKDAGQDVQVDAHEGWLSDLVRMTAVFKLGAVSIMLAIGLVTALTVAGAVRSRMAIHHNELELLHIMGADDGYISRQFQKYIVWLCGRGILAGFVIGGILVGGLQLWAMTSDGTLPALRLAPWQFCILPLIALALLFVSGWTARLTALKVLRAMP